MAECPWEALRDPTLPDGAKTVLTALWRRAGSSGRFVWPSPETLATDCGMKPRTLRKHLATLRDREWVSRSTAADGRRGWTLCDPPGEAVHVADEFESEQERHEDAGMNVPSTGTNVPNERQEHAEDPNVPARACQENGTSVPPLLYRNQRHEPTVGKGAEPSPPSRSIGVHAWRMDFGFKWRARFDPAVCGCRVFDPTGDGRRWAEVQRWLDDVAVGPKVLTDVLLHAAERVVRWHETGGQHGLPPKMFAVTFRADKPDAFPALLDDWQADTGRKRHTGKVPAAPAEIDGVRLTDEEQRTWLVTDGDVAARQDAVRGLREEQEARELVARSAIGELLGGAA